MGLDLLIEDLPLYSIPSEIIENLNDSKKSCDNAVEVVNDLLTYDKLESNTLVLETEEIDVFPFVTQTIHPFFIQVRCLFFASVKPFMKNHITLRHVKPRYNSPSVRCQSANSVL
jgi:signal transduction histidine kinase